jgi:hypothetical protein
MKETRKQRSARKRVELMEEFKELLFQAFEKEQRHKPEGAWTRACETTDLYINALIKQKPQEKTLILDAGLQFAKILETSLEKIERRIHEDESKSDS